MSNDEFDKLSNGEIDILIAERIMGWKWRTVDKEQPDQVPFLVGPHPHDVYYPKVEAKFDNMYPVGNVPPYSTDIAAAWKVIDQIRKEEVLKPDECFRFGWELAGVLGCSKKQWCSDQKWNPGDTFAALMLCKNPARMICIAALKNVKSNEKDAQKRKLDDIWKRLNDNLTEADWDDIRWLLSVVEKGE